MLNRRHSPGMEAEVQIIMAVLAQLLNQSPILSRLPEAARQPLLENASLVQLEAREHLFHMGDEAQYFFLINSGTLDLYRPSYSGDHKLFRTLSSGDLLVETVMFLKSPEYPLSARATTKASCYRLSRDSLLQVCQAVPVFSLELMSSMALSISQSLNRIDLLTTGNAAQRLVLYLMDLYMQQRRAWLTLPGSKHVVARQLNITPETLSRQLAGFKRAGLIGTQGSKQLVILDADSLCATVDLPPPQLEPGYFSPSRQLGKSLFDCCNVHHS